MYIKNLFSNCAILFHLSPCKVYFPFSFETFNLNYSLKKNSFTKKYLDFSNLEFIFEVVPNVHSSFTTSWNEFQVFIITSHHETIHLQIKLNIYFCKFYSKNELK